ncbi:Fe-S oxidoreductase [Cupriavidus sp. USMAHM13]|nr:DUF1289 domain-containing protein [Cupriavidus sp. USMAHM13]AOY98416.1 Fe-S oxidoreductase [Cupriavidus sp. USMAHM13]
MPWTTVQLADLQRQAEAAQRAVPVPSPCRNVCRMDAAGGWCEGCLRTIDEIAAWSNAAEADKRRIWASLPGRAQQLAGSGTMPPQ